jgi:hypothetical protein
MLSAVRLCARFYLFSILPPIDLDAWSYRESRRHELIEYTRISDCRIILHSGVQANRFAQKYAARDRMSLCGRGVRDVLTPAIASCNFV